MSFVWDTKKAAANHRQHGVSFEEASGALRDTFSATAHDPDHPVNVTIRSDYLEKLHFKWHFLELNGDAPLELLIGLLNLLQRNVTLDKKIDNFCAIIFVHCQPLLYRSAMCKPNQSLSFSLFWNPFNHARIDHLLS